jgi:D-tyrosyl-tRNA(Tyr) deacylase
MRALLQRVSRASVEVEGERIATIGPGLLVLLGVAADDDERTAEQLAERIAQLRIFRDEAGRTNRSVVDVAGEALVVSQFTLYADTSRGRRPGFTDAGPPEPQSRSTWRSPRRSAGPAFEMSRRGGSGPRCASSSSMTARSRSGWIPERP